MSRNREIAKISKSSNSSAVCKSFSSVSPAIQFSNHSRACYVWHL